jgi:intracellular septation protein
MMKLLADFFPVILFFVAYKLYGIYVATAVAIAASFVQVGYGWWRNHRVENMHLFTLGILVVFGGLTILLQDRTFIMWKPSVINWLFGVAFIASQFVGDKPLVERMMGANLKVTPEIWRKLNAAWGIFFLSLGFLNLYVANDFFVAEQQLMQATGLQEIDLDNCNSLFHGTQLEMCNDAHSLEESWVNFKLFGMLGLTIGFIVLQAFYLARHIQDPENQPETEES